MKVRATLRLRNDALVSARERLGLTQAQAAERCDVPTAYYVCAEAFNLRGSKAGRRPMLVETAMKHAAKIAAGMGIPVDAIMSQEFLDHAPKTEISVVAEMSPRAMLEASGRFAGRNALPADALSRHEEVADALRKGLERLPSKHRQALTLLYGLDGGGERSPDDVAKAMLVSRVRVDQLRRGAICRLQSNERFVDAMIDEAP